MTKIKLLDGSYAYSKQGYAELSNELLYGKRKITEAYLDEEGKKPILLFVYSISYIEM